MNTKTVKSLLTCLVLISSISIQSPAQAVVATNPTADCSAGTTCTVTFASASDYYQWSVPGGVNSLTVDVQGAQGGAGSGGSAGGRGGRVQGSLSVTPGQTLYFYVGGVGQAYSAVSNGVRTAGGFNGGGTGGYDGSGYTATAGGGGGASDIRTTAGSLASRIVIAGGGGGSAGGNTAVGGYGGYTSGGDGASYNLGVGGGGGTQSGGGTSSTTRGATLGSLGTGGDGGVASAYGGGGGGGGYYGGGGGYSGQNHGSGWAGGGGGGSSWYSGSLTSVTTTNDFRSAAGQILVTYSNVAPVVTTSIAGNVKAVNKGSVIALTTNVDQPGKVTFFANGKRIPGCIGISTSAGNVTCNWKPSAKGNVSITASIYQNGILRSSSPVLVLTSTKRTNTR